jgi:hypothetical protein
MKNREYLCRNFKSTTYRKDYQFVFCSKMKRTAVEGEYEE